MDDYYEEDLKNLTPSYPIKQSDSGYPYLKYLEEETRLSDKGSSKIMYVLNDDKNPDSKK